LVSYFSDVAHTGGSAVKLVLLVSAPSLAPFVVVPLPREANGKVGGVTLFKLNDRFVHAVPVRVGERNGGLAVNRPAVEFAVEAGTRVLVNDPILKFHVFRRFSRAVIREQILTGFIGNLRSVAHACRSAVKFVLL